MKALPELEGKLKRRLNLEKATSPVASASPPRCRSGTRPPYEASDTPGGTERQNSLREEVQKAARERDEALEQRERVEHEGMSKSIELSSEVARLRVDVEVLRKDLEEAQREVGKLRRGACWQERRDRAAAEKAVHASLELALAEARAEQLAAEVAGSAAERITLEEQVAELEEQVASHVVGRVRLEALLRRSEVKEAEMRRLLDAAGAGQRHSSLEVSVKEFSLHADDEEEESLTGTDVGDIAQVVDDDLEQCYQGLDLGAVLLRQGRDAAWKGEAHPCLPPSAATSAPAGDALYEGPLRALELALARIRSSGAGSGGADDDETHHSSSLPGPAAGTGEAVDDVTPFDEHLAHLQQALGRLSAARIPPTPSPLHTEEVHEGAGEPPGASQPAKKEPEPFSSSPDPPAQPPAAAPAAGASGVEALAEAPLVGFGLFSPYAMLGRKYRTPGS